MVDNALNVMLGDTMCIITTALEVTWRLPEIKTYDLPHLLLFYLRQRCVPALVLSDC